MKILSHLPKLQWLALKPQAPVLLRHHHNLGRRVSPPPILCLFSSLSTASPAHNFSLRQQQHQQAEEAEQGEDEDEEEDEPQVLIPIDKLFVPPETGIPDPTMTARILKGSNIVLSKYARDAQVVKAEFVKSSVNTQDCPSDGLPEFALVGRSNVGKSSLLNSLVRRKKLALTSKKPGKTQCINHFRINDSWYLVDLPGYGYASAPQEARTDWNAFTKDYFLKRSTLLSVFLLIDATIPAKKIDLEYASWLGQNQIPMTVVFTKCDKRKKKRHGGVKPDDNVKNFQDLIGDYFQSVPPWIMTSSVTNQGRDEILLHMAQLRNYWLKH